MFENSGSKKNPGTAELFSFLQDWAQGFSSKIKPIPWGEGGGAIDRAVNFFLDDRPREKLFGGIYLPTYRPI